MPSSLDSRGLSHSGNGMEREPLAVIGIGCRLPGGVDSPTAFWDALLRGFDGIRDVPDDRWKHSRFHDPNPEKAGCIRNAKGGFLDGVDLFDAEFFGYFPTEAQRMDPQQRLLLEVTHEALEDAGVRRDQLDGTRTSVFIGSFMYDYLCIQSAGEQRDEINPYVAMGTGVSPLANRISYDFNLKGPSVSLDTACSSSLVAVHLACRSLWGGEADLAIAGGVNLMLRPESSIMLSKAGFLNPDQYCKAFDAAANGYVRGEGAGVVLLKPLRRALADGDAIYACVRASAVNQDGYMPEGFTVPNVVSQIDLLQTVYAQAGIDPATVAYVEAHGTGTAVGDPIESLAIGAVLGRPRPPGERCLIGSVKTNVGHLEGASGITGFIKGVLAAQHGLAPPNLHFHEPNPGIDWESLEVPVQPTPLRRAGCPCIVGVNSFGAGGTNAHVVLEQSDAAAASSLAAESPARGQPAAGATLYVLSSPQKDSLRMLALRHADLLHRTPEHLADAAFSAFTRRSHFANLVAVVGETAQDVESQLRKFADGQVEPTILATAITRKKNPQLAFVFSGQGGQWARMGQQWLQREAVFRHTLEEIDGLFQQLAGWSLLAELAKPEAESRINETLIVQPAVLAIQIALTRLYAHYGIRPAAVVGHSIGEVAAAFAAGALTLEQAVQVIYHRSQAQNQVAGRGGMLAVGLGLDEARRLIAGEEGRVSIAAVNGPEMLTLSGDAEPLQRIAQILESRGVFQRPVQVQVAYHSHHMEAIQQVMLETLATAQGVEAATPLYSTVTGQRESGTHLDAEYWYHNVRHPVLLTDALDAMLHDGFDTFVEIGPHPVLVGGANALFKKRNAKAMIASSMTRREPEVTVFLQSLAQLAARGLAPDTERLFGSGRRYIRLPKYPWQHTRHWFESPAAAELRRGRFEHPFLKRQTQLVTEEGLAVWEAAVDVPKFPYLRDHRVDGEVVFPASGHLELAWAVAGEQFRHEPFFLEHLHFDLPLILPENSRYPLDVRLEIVSGEGDYRICSRPADAAADTPWARHSSGRINTLHDRFDSPRVSLDDLRRRFDDRDSLPVEPFYDTIRAAGLDYGVRFRCIQQLWHRGHEILVRLELPADLVHESRRNHVHPALLDACLHAVFADVHRHGDPERIFLPYRIDRVRFHRPAPPCLWAYVSVSRNDQEYLVSDTLMFTADGERVAELIGMTSKRLVGAGSHPTDAVYDGCYEYRWLPAPWDPEQHRRIIDGTHAVLIADSSDSVAPLAAWLEREGIRTRQVDISSGKAFAASLAGALADSPLDRRTLIVLAPGLSGCRPGWTNLADCPFIPVLLELAQALHRRQAVPRVVLVTCGAAGVAGDRQLDLGQAILHGMRRVINNELANVPLTTIDLSPEDPGDALDALCRELLYSRRDRDEAELALRGPQRFVRQLVAVDRDSAERSAAVPEAACGGLYRAEVSDSGTLDHVAFRRFTPRPPGDDEVEIAVQAAALNFKDVMNAMGLLPAQAVSGGLAGQRLGLEVAGHVVRTGNQVRQLRPGDEVIGRVANGLGGRVTAPACFVTRRPATLTPQQAAAVPVVYITAWYSLCHLARMARGESVLVHSAAGGVGGAAIQLAQRAGATVLATAGTKEKREFLRRQGVAHVFDSRSLDFYTQVMDATGGRGVDIVLNSLAGRAVTQSLKCLAPFGRFVELGKTDVYRNSKLGLERLGENLSYFVVDVDRLALQKPELHREIMAQVVALFERGELVPHEITEFPMSRLVDAMKLMTRSAFRGKIVLSTEQDAVAALPPRQAEFRPDRSYLISGGASGFGLQIAQWMAARGARNLVLLSRSGPKSDEDREALESLRSRGVRILLAHADITDRAAIDRLVLDLSRELLPLAGVIHGAAVLEDASLPTMDMRRFERVFAPKAQGAWNLHAATSAAGAELDFFLMLSSISSMFGVYGQLNYAAANFFQDSLALYRRQLGLPATSVNLGLLGDYAGMSQSKHDQRGVVTLLESHGMLVMPLADVLAKLEAALVQQPIQRMAARFDWSRFRTAYPHLARDARFVDWMSGPSSSRGNRTSRFNLRAALAELEPEARQARLQHELTAVLARMLDAAPDKIDVSVSIENHGLDSLMLTELQVWIVRLLDINLPLIKLLKGPSIATLAADLLAQWSGSLAAGAAGVPSPEPTAEAFTLADLDGIRVLNPWLIRGCGRAEAPVRLVCFHSMGVGASLFTKYLLDPWDDCDILAVQTPGRENRVHEPLAASVEELADRIAERLLPLLDRPAVIWGHSFGGIVAAEVIRRVRDRHQREPAHLLVTGTIAPHLVHIWQQRTVILKSLDADNSPEYLISLSRYVDDPQFLKSILPNFRRDWPLLEKYRFQPLAPLRCPITALAARQDEVVYADEVREWSRYTADGFELIEVDGDHWFLDRNRKQITALLHQIVAGVRNRTARS